MTDGPVGSGGDAPLIAVVNDDRAFLELLWEVLTGEGYRAVLYREGARAAAAIRRAPPALVILDLRLGTPGAGWRVLEELRRERATGAIPVIVCSADHRALREQAARLARLGCAVVEKPFDLDDLLATIAAALDRVPGAGGGAGPAT